MKSLSERWKVKLQITGKEQYFEGYNFHMYVIWEKYDIEYSADSSADIDGHATWPNCIQIHKPDLIIFEDF